MHYATIKTFDIANGPGARTSLFVSGCTHGCPGCFNAVAWDFNYGEPFTQETEDSIIESLKPAYVTGLTLLGGDPMEPSNQRALVGLCEHIKKELSGKTIWCYTGDLIEDLLNPESERHTEVTERLFNTFDVLVDGPWVQDLYDITLRFRGSSNQRLIDVPKTLAQGSVVLWEDEKIFADHGLPDTLEH